MVDESLSDKPELIHTRSCGCELMVHGYIVQMHSCRAHFGKWRFYNEFI